MASEDESISTAVMAEDAAERARKLILALHRYGDALDVRAIAEAVADGARRGATAAVSGRLPTMSRADADMYAAAAASGAVSATLTAIADCLTGTEESLNARFDVEDEITMAAALTSVRVGAKGPSSGNIFLFRHFILAFSVVMAVVSVLLVVF